MTGGTANITAPQMCLGLLVIRFNVTTEIYATVIATSAVNIASGLCAAVSNVLVFVAILRTPHLHTSTNILLANLCVTDFLVGSIVQPFYVAKKVTELFGQPICEVRLVYTYFGFLCTCASMLGLCLVSGERFIAVVRPLTYYSCVTKPRMYVCVGVMWLCWAVVCLTPFLVVPFDIFFQLVFCIIISSFLFMAAIYCRVFREAKRHQQRISAITASIESKVDLRRENKVARTMAIVVGAVMCCYLPQISLLLARALHGDSTRLVHVGDAWADTIVFLNSAFNPFIYCYRNSEIRHSVLRYLKKRQSSFLILVTQRRVTPSTT